MAQNRRLLVSVFNGQEAREALIGGARIIDCEDPRTSLGNISPIQIMRIAETTLSYKTDERIQVSTNIGEEQLLFDKGTNGVAIQKFSNEIAGKAAQAALGVAASMGTVVHPVNIIKVGIDAMNIELIEEVLKEIVLTIRRSDSYNHSQIVPVFFIRDITIWNERKNDPKVIKQLLDLREFYFDNEGTIDLADYYSDAEIGRILSNEAKTTYVSLNEVSPYSNFGFKNDTQEMLKQIVDLCAKIGVDGLMLDTSIQYKIIRVGLLKHPKNIKDKGIDGKEPPREGILTIDEAALFCKYCHWAGIESYLAGSIQDYHAEELWKIKELDSIAVRGSASKIVPDPFGIQKNNDTRHERRITRELVAKLIPPEQQ
ncbi:(5-formylfuran-3-yl)methyl phosphate synthase [Bacillus cereus]|uniref:(5-formylfuran-3-yl)methyl phosphate synthase n=1 Tax=Bacillus cereus TaxID=1396 RepID=UPI003D646EA6